MFRRRSLNWEMSAPATNARSPAPRRMTTRIASSPARSAMYPGMSCHISWLTALRRSGLLKVIQPIGPSLCISSPEVSVIALSSHRGMNVGGEYLAFGRRAQGRPPC